MSDKNRKRSLFDIIAPFYGLFYNIQKYNFRNVLNDTEYITKLAESKNILDVGCGTGALCSILKERGLDVTGVDPSQKMLDIAIDKTNNKSIKFIKADIIRGLPMDDKSFDVSVSSFVAHGLKERERKIMYSEMQRVTRKTVIIYDYNQNRTAVTNLIEWLEGGDYFNFIKIVQEEMNSNFKNVKIVNVGNKAALYICEPY